MEFPISTSSNTNPIPTITTLATNSATNPNTNTNNNNNNMNTNNNNNMSSSGVRVVGSDAPSNYQVAHRSITTSPVVLEPTANQNMTPVTITQAPLSSSTTNNSGLKKKRGRPRKYAPDGSLNNNNNVTTTLSPKPISSAPPPPVIDFSSPGQKQRGKVVRPVSAVKMVHHHAMEGSNNNNSIGDWVSCSVGANFTPHIITVNTGEDITMKIISFSQQGPRAICILSANGVVSSVTLRQPDSSGGTLTYEGRFEILSLTGSFMPSESGGMRNRSGGMSVSLASPDGRVVGGGVAGLLVAASPVQIVVGSFLAGNQQEQKTKKQKLESSMTFTHGTAAVPVPVSSAGMEDASYHNNNNNNNSSSFRGDSWSSMPTESRNTTDINLTLPA